MKFSIVTISFNQDRFLEEAIVSVLAQDYPDVEYIIVDPGSTDGSRDIIERYRYRVDKMVLEPDRGPPDGLNRGFAYATGNVFGFLNSDDILEPNTLRSVAEYFNSNGCIDVVSGHSWIIDADGNVNRRLYSDRFSLWMAGRGAAILAQPSTFFRAELFRQVGGFNIENDVAWDGELLIDMARAGARFARVNQFWSRYRVHRGGITSSRSMSDARQKYRRSVFRKIYGRELTTFDRVSIFGAKQIRKVANPRDVYERLMHGPVGKVAWKREVKMQ